jgi:hypothetical protein
MSDEDWGASLARALARQAYAVALLSRGTETSTRVAEEIRLAKQSVVVQTTLGGPNPCKRRRMLGQSLVWEFHRIALLNSSYSCSNKNLFGDAQLELRPSPRLVLNLTPEPSIVIDLTFSLA